MAVVVVVMSEHSVLAAQAWPFRQHPPPREAGQLKKFELQVDAAVAGPTMIVVGETTVVVTVDPSGDKVTVVVYPLVTTTVVPPAPPPPLAVVRGELVEVGLTVPVVTVRVGSVVVTVRVP